MQSHARPLMQGAVILLLSLLASCGPSPAPERAAGKDAGPGVSLKPEEMQNLGIVTAAARSATYRRQVTGYGVVVALDAIAQNDAEYRTAVAAAAQSAAAARRAHALATGDEAAVSREVAEAADSKAASDQAALLLARRRTDAAFGLGAPWQSPVRRRAVMAALASGKSVLVRVTFPLGALGTGLPAELTVARLGTGMAGWKARDIWDAPADPAFPGRSFYVLVDGSGLAQNERVLATVPAGPEMAGVTVPAAAALIGEGESWVYVEDAVGHFTRARIDTATALGKNYFLPRNGGIAPGARIVVSGASLLLSHERNPGGGGD